MSDLVRSELLKIRTIRSWWAYLIVIVLLSGLAVAGEIGSTDDANRGTLDFQLSLVETTWFAAVLALILAINFVTTEFRFGTVTPTFLAAPERERVIGAKTIVGVVVGIGFSLLSLVVIAAVAVPWLVAIGAETHLGAGEIGTRAAQQILLAVLWALMGVAIGTLVHNQVAALVGTLVWIFLGESLLYGLFILLDLLGLLDRDTPAAYLPFRALDGADGTGGEDLLEYWPAVAVSLGWIALLGAVGTLRTRRRDIS